MHQQAILDSEWGTIIGNCGVLVCWYAESLARNLSISMNFEGEEIKAWRLQAFHILKTLAMGNINASASNLSTGDDNTATQAFLLPQVNRQSLL